VAAGAGPRLTPPVERIGALDVDGFLPKRERRSVAATLGGRADTPIIEREKRDFRRAVTSGVVMSPQPAEHLVLLDHGHAGQALAELRRVATVTQVHAPRLVLVRADAGVNERVAQVAGVLAVFCDGQGQLPSDLTNGERWFAAGWAQRFGSKARMGDGEPWDAPEFLPPDEPPEKRS
jgi:hypothetical protein